jgi:glycerol-3-phosphate acyltransferase PlsY
MDLRMSPEFLLMLVIAYLSGSLPWSVWLSQRVSGVDPRTVADGNPGAANAFRTAGWRVGVIVLVLDFLKAFMPVLIARYLLNFPDNELLWIALVPMVGHAFSIFLRWHGGRGLTSMFGVWAGLTLYEVPIVMGITAITATRFIKNDELKTLLIPIVAGIYLLLQAKPAWMLWLVLAQFLLMLTKIIPFYLAKVREVQA